MKTLLKITMSFLFILSINNVKAQTVAQDFTMTSCAGPSYNLFSHLDQEEVVIIEFFMLNCGSCITAGNKINSLYNTLNQQYPGRVQFLQMGYTNSYTCNDLTTWGASHGYNSVMFDSGAAQVAYYGGFGMPTIAVLAGSQHQVLFKRVGFLSNDTTLMGTAARGFLNTTTGLNTIDPNLKLNVYPNPVQAELNIEISSDLNDVSFSVIDIAGKKMQIDSPIKINEGHFRLNTSGLQNGLYILQMVSQEGKTTSSRFTVSGK